MNTRLLFVASAALSLLVGCNPSGTCVSEKERSDLGADCTINVHKNFCTEMDATTFFAENGAAGTLRCKSAGYGDPAGVPHPTDLTALHIYYRKSAKK